MAYTADACVYALIDPRDGQVRYVGQTKSPKTRLTSHLSFARRGSRQHCSRWIAKLIRLGLTPAMAVLAVLPDQTQRNEAERYWIAFFKKSGCVLTNATDGGVCGWQTKHTDDARRKIGEASRRLIARRGPAHYAAMRARNFKPKCRPVQTSCGERFISLSDAAEKLGVTKGAVRSAILRSGYVMGLKVSYINGL